MKLSPLRHYLAKVATLVISFVTAAILGVDIDSLIFLGSALGGVAIIRFVYSLYTQLDYNDEDGTFKVNILFFMIALTLMVSLFFLFAVGLQFFPDSETIKLFIQP